MAENQNFGLIPFSVIVVINAYRSQEQVYSGKRMKEKDRNENGQRRSSTLKSDL